ncbi:MAG TPA: putative metal-dependent hydrolase [Blastocatellia bacterium]|nr:putative metal-dependent hydrolase [Blastocatellia bacterium]
MADGLRYPIGEFVAPQEMGREQRLRLIDEVAALPALLRRAVAGLSEEQLDTPYRPGGWTVRQVVHHLPDSHLNGYARMKLALTEHLPTIKTYDQEAWVAATDLRVPVEASLRLLEGLHHLWSGMLRSLSEEQWQRGFIHPEMVGLAAGGGQADAPWRRAFAADERGVITVAGILPTYAWHGRHHTAHITSLRERMGWDEPCPQGRAI